MENKSLEFMKGELHAVSNIINLVKELGGSGTKLEELLLLDKDGLEKLIIRTLKSAKGE